MSGNPFEFGIIKEKPRNIDVELQKEMEKIEWAYARIMEQYGKYDGCKDFIEYLRTMEKIFAESRMRNWNADVCKDELIRIKISLLASQSRLPQQIFQAIYDDFISTSKKVNNVYDISSNLLRKYKDSDCREFIKYIEYVIIHYEEGDKNTGEVIAGLIRARMLVLSSDGNHDLVVLEKIYKEFNKLLEKDTE